MSFVLVFIAMLTIVAAMSVGVLFGREPIRGSCGGLGQLGIDGDCELCGGSPAQCAESRPSPIHEDAGSGVRYVDPPTLSRD